jgi:general secretion pathway protein C
MAVDQILRKNFWAVLLLFVVAAAFLNAQAVSHLVGVVLSPEPQQLALASLASQQKAGSGSEVNPHATSAEPLFSRNPFDSQTGPLNAPLLEITNMSKPDTPVDLGDPMNAPPCDGVKVLIITKADNPDWSFAAFGGGPPDNKTILRRRDGDVGDKKVEFIGWDRVWLKTPAQRCQAKLFNPVEAPKPPEKKEEEKPRGTGGPSTLDPAITKGIKKTGPNEYDIDRAVVDKIMENQADLMRSARIVPEQENGKTVGIRMFGVKEGTLLGVLGMENGDRLQQINGFDMSSPEKALEAYARLRTADHLTVQVNRRGTNTNLDYSIK